MDLASLGWNSHFQRAYEALDGAGLLPARVANENRGRCTLFTEAGLVRAHSAGALRHAAAPGELPVTGDWVAAQPCGEAEAVIQSVLPRASSVERRAAGPRPQRQVLAANVDVLFLVSGLDRDYNLGRIERYLAMALNSGARPVVVLNKCDCRADAADAVAEVEAIAAGAEVTLVSAKTGAGVERLLAHLQPGQTGAFLGSSGVGKSSLINRLAGWERQTVKDVREDDSRGRHTTTGRELILLDNGALLIDTPGLRELQLWTDESAVDAAFGDVEALAAACRFRDCTHGKEPGCAVQAALASGDLDPKRYRSCLKLQREAQYAALDRKVAVEKVKMANMFGSTKAFAALRREHKRKNNR